MTITRETIEATARRINPFIRRTPAMDMRFDGLATPVALKLELFQHTGSFKARGAFSNLVDVSIPAAGVAAASGGNHGAAVAFAARAMGVAARIFVPVISSPAKVARIASYGAEIVQQGANYQEALEICEAYVSKSGALNIHAYNTETTLQGPGTLALELKQQAPHLDTILVSVGGGGLIGGMAAYYQHDIKIIAVEPQTCNALEAALHAKKPVTIKPSGLAADSLGASSVGALPFEFARQYVDRVVLVSDDDIRNAQRHLWSTAQLVTEPGGAAAFAALLSGAYRPTPGERLGIIICGANTELQKFNNLFRKD
jgi:threonine dehydratase